MGVLAPPVTEAVLKPWGNYVAPKNFANELKLCLLNTPPSTFTRAPGHPKSALIVETMLQHAAHATGLALLDVQMVNLNPKLDVQLPLVTELVSKTGMEARQHEVTQFNTQNPHKKRGIAMAPWYVCDHNSISCSSYR